MNTADDIRKDTSHDGLWEMLGALHRDVTQACDNLTADDTPYNRRAYVRAAFASIEAITWFIKQDALRHRETGLFSLAETALLLEESYSLDKGKAEVQTKFQPLDQSFPFAVQMFSRGFKSPFVLKKAKGWEAFKKAIQIRHRVTHPKRCELLEVSDQELEDVGTAYGWVVGSIISPVSESAFTLRSEVEKMAKEHGIAL